MKIETRAILACLAMLLCAPMAQAGKNNTPMTPDDLTLIEVGVVADVPRATVITLQSGKSYALDEIRVPFSHEATVKSHLKASLLNKKVGLYAAQALDAPDATDRMGNFLVHILREDGSWVQADLVGAGLVWASSTQTNRALVRALYRREKSAREDKAGLWANPDYAVKTKETIKNYLNSYQVYEGEVTERGFLIKGDAGFYLDRAKSSEPPPFGVALAADSAIPSSGPGSFSDGKLLKKQIRVHGWVEKENNIPTIRITHPEQVEFIDAPPAPG